MDRYVLFFIINLPFIFFGIIRAFAMYKESVVGPVGLFSRLVFWILIALALGFARDIYIWLYDKGLVNSKVISLTTVLLGTGIIFSFFLIIRVYSKIDTVEKRQVEMLTKLAILDAERINKN